MKKLIFAVMLTTTISFAFGQVSVEGVDINELGIRYCELKGYNKSLIGQKIIVVVDYGQEFKAFQSQVIKGADGKPTVFHTMIDALNFMEDNGWEYVNSYAVTVGNSNVYHYLLRRKE